MFCQVRASSGPWYCGNPVGISKACGKGGKRLLLSMLSTRRHFHGQFWDFCESEIRKAFSCTVRPRLSSTSDSA